MLSMGAVTGAIAVTKVVQSILPTKLVDISPTFTSDQEGDYWTIVVYLPLVAQSYLDEIAQALDKTIRPFYHIRVIRPGRIEVRYDETDANGKTVCTHRTGITEERTTRPSASCVEAPTPCMVPVVSSNIDSIGYNYGRCELLVRFTRGALYRYSGVREVIYNDFMAAPSKGQFFAKYIKGNTLLYTCEKVSD